MRFLILIACLWAAAATSSGNPVEIHTFDQFKSVFNKTCASVAEEAIRRDNFYRSLKWIEQNQGKHGATFGINELSDLSESEFQGTLSMDPRAEDFYAAEPTIHVTADKNLPTHWDWREHAHLQPIENQHQCGACWAFSSLAAVEAAYAIKHNVQVQLSKQELIDCTKKTYDKNYQNNGCSGGHATEGYK